MSNIKTAVILAAGLGSRLGKITKERPKGLVEVDGKPILDYIIESIISQGFTKIVVVGGYKAEMIGKHVRAKKYPIQFDMVYNHYYATTNNIYSLWIAFARLRLDEGFVLIESDLVFDKEVLANFKTQNAIALDIYNPEIHLGTTATVNKDGYLDALYFRPNLPNKKPVYKTVNICSFDDDTVSTLFYMLDSYIQKGDVNTFYESVIHDMVVKKNLDFKVVSFENNWWDEIDNATDLERVTKYLNSKKS